jgi:carbonic anhydrase
VYRLHLEELSGISDEGERYNRLAELSVKEQCINVIKTAAVQSAYLENRYPEVHGWVFDIRHGLIKDLEIDFHAALKDIQQVYNLMDRNWM